MSQLNRDKKRFGRRVLLVTVQRTISVCFRSCEFAGMSGDDFTTVLEQLFVGRVYATGGLANRIVPLCFDTIVSKTERKQAGCAC